MKHITAFLLAMLLSGATFATNAQSLQPIDRIAAVVNEDVILRSELDRAVANVRSTYAGREAQLPPQEVLERQVMERLVLMRLQLARAADSGIKVGDDEVDAAIANIARSNQISVDQMRQQLAAQGTTYPDFRNSVRDELATQRLRQAFAQSRISVSEAEVEAMLATQANAGGQYRLAHILVSVPDGATSEQLALAQKKIDGVKGLLDKGEMDFTAAAARYSDSPNALEGGDLGWRSLDQIPAAFATTLRSMQPGQVVGPIRGPSGFQLLKLVETRAAPAANATVTQYQARHILVRVPEGNDGAAAKAKIDTLRARIAGGADFAAVAKESSEDAVSKAKGGELGWFAGDAYGPEFGAQITTLPENTVSAPFRTNAGWHIVQKTGSRQVAANADEGQRERVRQAIGQRKLEEEWNRFLRELRGEAYVDVRSSKPAAPATGG